MRSFKLIAIWLLIAFIAICSTNAHHGHQMRHQQQQPASVTVASDTSEEVSSDEIEENMIDPSEVYQDANGNLYYMATSEQAGVRYVRL
mgnify:CR=1 FL=1